MDHDKAASFASLPSELIIQILDIAAASSKRTAFALCLVSSWTCKLARRHLLESIAVSTPRQTRLFLYGLRHAKDRPGNAAMVRRMWLSPPTRDDCMIGLMPHLRDLAITPAALCCGIWAWDSPATLPAHRPLVPRSCDLRLAMVSCPNIQSPFAKFYRQATAEQDERARPAILRSVTHLSYALIADEQSARSVIGWSKWHLSGNIFPRLTHFAIRLPMDPEHGGLDILCTDALVNRSPPVRVMVLVVTALSRSSWGPAFLASLSERFPRLCILDVRETVGEDGADAKEWLEDVWTGNSIWDRASRLHPDRQLV
ncbi:hypothetical protein PLICRDRAFT_452075 [Plicaturopsis crispa FD-325 SS-3]|uniref:F-box domain-containing protein n=1 Tax=Plicaturopsis crispa FD-325 SS-3 TaxID=944288 RepID=A0A0C9SKA6_PLICR|nr:hypothetical protein PLICRDRAFT_452075 [Plicaturopsis crispa FD-325 SS-3]